MVLGEKAVLSCVVFNYTGIVQWTKDGLALGISEGLRGKEMPKLSPLSLTPCAPPTPTPPPGALI